MADTARGGRAKVPLGRRAFLRKAAALGGMAALGASGTLLAGCRPEEGQPIAEGQPITEAARQAPAGGNGPVRTVRLVAGKAEVDVAPGYTTRMWCYNGQYPGPELRAKEGERLRIIVENRLPENTTVHWHGLPVPNAMDGVPELTQPPIASGETLAYEFTAGPPGSYLYHSHVGLQLDRGLVGPLVIEERRPMADYDREYTVALDDLLLGAPQPLGQHVGLRRRPPRVGTLVPPYAGLLMNGRLPRDPPTFEAQRGERVRLRFINLSGATTFRVALAGHRMRVISSDGRPIEPRTVDALALSMGERYDVIVEAEQPGAWTLMAAPLEVQAPPARGVFRYRGVARMQPPEGQVPRGIQRGKLLMLEDLISAERGRREPPVPDRMFDLALYGGQIGPSLVWTMGGQTYPEAEPLEIQEGERVRIRMVNRSMMFHPMHLHGHFFRVGEAVKDTVLMLPHQRATLDFVADNPGRWLFHCHNVYHMESGMAREIRYV